jgi:hypothetical protein
LACAGTGLLWRSDFQNARQLLQALARRIDKPKKVRAKKNDSSVPTVAGAAFHTHRQAQAQRTRILSQILIELEGEAIGHFHGPRLPVPTAHRQQHAVTASVLHENHHDHLFSKRFKQRPRLL